MEEGTQQSICESVNNVICLNTAFGIFNILVDLTLCYNFSSAFTIFIPITIVFNMVKIWITATKIVATMIVQNLSEGFTEGKHKFP